MQVMDLHLYCIFIWFLHKWNIGRKWVSQERWDTSFEFERTRKKVASDNNSRQICERAIIKLSLAYSFRKMFFIGKNLKHVHMTYFFLELEIWFWLTLVIQCLEFISHHTKRNIVREYKLHGEPIMN